MGTYTPDNDGELYLQEVQKILDVESDFNESQIQILLDKAQAIIPNDPRVAELRTVTLNRYRKIQEDEKYTKAKLQCELLWGKEQELIKARATTEKILDYCYIEAVEIAREASQAYPQSLKIDGLKNDAELRYQMARKRYEIKTTADHIGEYQIVFEELEKIEDQETLIPWTDKRGFQLEPISVREAIIETLKLASDFAHRKAQEYLQLAQSELEKHSPRIAQEQIEKRKYLWELHPEDNKRLQKYLDENIIPEIKRLEKAEELLQLAQSATDSERGLELIDQALSVYPWISGVEESRKTLILRTLHKARFLLEQAEAQSASNVFDENIPQATNALIILTKIDDYIQQAGNDALSQDVQSVREHAQALLTQRKKIIIERKFVVLECRALIAQGRQFLDRQDYRSAQKVLSEAFEKSRTIPNNFFNPEDTSDINSFLKEATEKSAILEALQVILKQANDAMRNNTPCSAVDILVSKKIERIEEQNFPELVTQIVDLKERAVLLCAERLAAEGQYNKAKSTLGVVSISVKGQKIFDEISAQQKNEHAIRVKEWENSLSERRKQLNAYFIASLITSISGLVLLIGGSIFLLVGNTSTGVIVNLGSVVPAVITKIFTDTYKDLRKEQQESLKKPQHEVELESKVFQNTENN